nr:beta-1,3-glucan-binding protein-like [Leptinotarsa decemlineata]
MYNIFPFATLVFVVLDKAGACKRSITTVSGSQAPNGIICSGDLIFEDDFNELDLKKWQHEQTLGGGGNWEFQWYTNNRSNSFVHNGVLHIRPTLLADDYGNDFLYSGTIGIPECTNADNSGCRRTGTATNILNPIKSARLRSLNSFSFKYGKVEVRAKLPVGDWLWPAIWMLPTRWVYSSWPTSGEVDIMESRGNKRLKNFQGVNIGVEQIGSTLHWGPNPANNKFSLTHYEKNNPAGYESDFHNYQVEWTQDQITFSVDGKAIGTVRPPNGGFWELGGLDASGLKNPWAGHSKMAPFDEEFHILINLAIGGVTYFPDDAINPGGKPWNNKSPKAATDFWEGRNQWLPTWNRNSDDSHLKVDYVKVWAL